MGYWGVIPNNNEVDYRERRYTNEGAIMVGAASWGDLRANSITKNYAVLYYSKLYFAAAANSHLCTAMYFGTENKIFNKLGGVGTYTFAHLNQYGAANSEKYKLVQYAANGDISIELYFPEGVLCEPPGVFGWYFYNATAGNVQVFTQDHWVLKGYKGT